MSDAQISNRTGSDGAFDSACTQLESILKGSARDDILTTISRSKSLSGSLLLLRRGMRSHLFKTRGNQLALNKLVGRLDGRTCQDGFHVLHDWDGKADKLNPETIPVDVLNYVLASREIGGTEQSHKKILAILLDYYFLYLLALLSLRVWDENDGDENLDRVNRLLEQLHGPAGSGQRFVGNAETLIFVSTSHYEPDERAYDRLLARVVSLNPVHRLNIALVHSAILGCHLRYGFEAQYGRDIAAMRKDNAPDYSWLCIALSTMMEAYSRVHAEGTHGTERERLVEGILSALSPDPRRFIGNPAEALAAH